MEPRETIMLNLQNHHRTLLALALLAGSMLAAGCPANTVPSDASGTISDIQIDGCQGDDCPTDACPGGCPIGVCHPDLAVCVACLEDDHCGDARCHPTTHACVACFEDGHCPGGKCTASLVCVECTQDLDCGKAGLCDPLTHTCVGDCSEDANCDDQNICTLDHCEAGACTYAPEPGTTLCEDGDACTLQDACSDGKCQPGNLDPACCEPVKCGTFLAPADTTGDGCDDTCFCPDGTLPNDKGECVCTAEPSCPKGSIGVDEDKDGCVESCTCVSADCLDCKSDKECTVPDDACTKGACVAGACEITVAANCCNTGCDCYDDGEPDMPCDTGVAHWLCKSNTCGQSCGVPPAELLACTCEDVTCKAGLDPSDTTGDGCVDTCLCPGGAVPGPDGCVSCTTLCDCYDSTLSFSKECIKKKQQWTCEEKLCIPTCAEPVPEAKLCLPCTAPPACEVGTLGVDTDFDGCLDTCVCGDGSAALQEECACLTPSECAPGSIGIDENKDGCVDWCQCDSGAAVKLGAGCPCLSPVSCKAGSAPVDTTGDGCPDICACEGEGCVACETDDACKDGSDCAQVSCVDGFCATKNICCAALDCVLGAQELDTNTDGCADTCHCQLGQKGGADACICPLSIACSPGSTPTDTNLDGCTDTCLVGCTDTCDCYKSADPNASACKALNCTECQPAWQCEEGSCVASCDEDGKLDPGCLDQGKTCTSNEECKAGSFCLSPKDDCKAPGTCVAIPTDCKDTQAPVCGCDGKKYPNACQAYQAHQSPTTNEACPTNNEG